MQLPQTTCAPNCPVGSYVVRLVCQDPRVRCLGRHSHLNVTTLRFFHVDITEAQTAQLLEKAAKLQTWSLAARKPNQQVGRFYKRVFPDGDGSRDAILRRGVSVLDAA